MSYLFDDDKKKLPLGKTSTLLWEGDGTEGSGITLDLEELGVDESKYRYFYVVFVGILHMVNDTKLFPTNQTFSGGAELSYSDIIEPSPGGGIIQCSITECYRNIYYEPAAHTISVGECIARENIYNADETPHLTWNYTKDNSVLVPYQLWGIE